MQLLYAQMKANIHIAICTGNVVSGHSNLSLHCVTLSFAKTKVSDAKNMI